MEPLVLSTWKFGTIASAAGWRVLTELGGSAVDAVQAACEAVEADPEVMTVGYGGLPDASGQVSLDAAIMLSPERSAGVAFIRSFAHPIRIARLVMEHSPHKLVVGEGAEQLARAFGLEEHNLRTAQAAAAWRRWLAEKTQARAPQPQSALCSSPEVASACGSGSSPTSRQPNGHDTIAVIARDVRGQIAAGCSTSGLPFKLPGRVGDSPLIGHGLYVDPKVGAAVATGHGELLMGVCGSFLAVECVRRGASPEEAAAEVIRRIGESFSHLEDKQAALIVLDIAGRWAAAALRPGFVVAVRSPDEEGVRDPQFVLFPAG